MLKKIAIVVVLLIVVVLGLAATKPDTFAVERETTINAPREKVFALINDFHQWGAWSPWEKIDPAMKRTFSGSPSGPGAIYEWSGNSAAGAGAMQITGATAPSNVEIKLDFTKPFESHNITDFTIDSTAAGTHVKWNMHGPNQFISKIMAVFVSMDKMIGPDFDSGLANLKVAAEKP